MNEGFDKIRQMMSQAVLDSRVTEFFESQKKLRSVAEGASLTIQPWLDSVRFASEAALKANFLNIHDAHSKIAKYTSDLRVILDSEAVIRYKELFSIWQEMMPKANYLHGTKIYNEIFYEIEYNSLFEKKFNEALQAGDGETQTIILDETARISRIIAGIYKDNQQLFRITPREFEEVTAELLRKQGFNCELSKQTRDGGYDIIAIHTIDGQKPTKWLVECKRYSAENKVGIEVIRGFKEVVQDFGANRGLIATTSYFTRDAEKKLIENPYLLDYRDKDAVLEWVYKYAGLIK